MTKRLPLLHPAGSFGYVARHGSPVKEWRPTLGGARQLNKNLYEVLVPREGKAELDTELVAIDKGSVDEWWLWLLILVIFVALGLTLYLILRRRPATP